MRIPITRTSQTWEVRSVRTFFRQLQADIPILFFDLSSFLKILLSSGLFRAGIAYHMLPPHTIKEVILDPIHTVIYITFMLSDLFSKMWTEVSGSGGTLRSS